MTFKRITELDFDLIKSNLIEHLKSQDFWKDYDLEASGINVLIGLLAYDTHYKAFYGNMGIKESFLDSASSRDSVVSLAKELGYVPRSISASKAVCDVIVSPSDNLTVLPNTLILEKGTVFRGLNENNSFDFTTIQSYSSVKDADGNHRFNDVEIYQGFFVFYDFIINENDVHQKLILPNKNIDVDKIEVYVQEGTDDINLTRYSLNENILSIDSQSRVFFKEEYSDGKFRIYFGDGILGKKVEHGKLVRVLLFQTEGKDGNGITDFKISSSKNDIFINQTVTVIPKGPSSGGDDPESIDSIKFHAPKNFISRKRAVSLSDWKEIISTSFPEVKSVQIWGGEDEEIPFENYGKVFISINPKDNQVITDSRKREILQILKEDFRVGTSIPVIIDPSLTFLNLDVTVELNPIQSLIDSETIKTSIEELIIDYSRNEMEQFHGDFNYSNLSSRIDDFHESIISNLINVTMENRLIVKLNKEFHYSTSYRNAIVPGSVTSNQITVGNVNVRLFDDENGTLGLRRVGTVDNNEFVFKSNVGFVDYDLGKLTFNPLRIQRADPITFDWRIQASPQRFNIKTKLNKILKIDKDNLNIVIEITRKNSVSRNFK